MKEITLEKMQECELERMSAFIKSIFKEHYDPIVGKETNGYMVDKYLSVCGISAEIRGGAEYYFVRKNGQDAGVLAIDKKDGFMYLSKFYLAKDFRGCGYSREMMEFVEKQTLDAGLNKIRLNVNAGNLKTIQTYRHFGFHVIEELQKDVGDGYSVHDFVMERALDRV